MGNTYSTLSNPVIQFSTHKRRKVEVDIPGISADVYHRAKEFCAIDSTTSKIHTRNILLSNFRTKPGISGQGVNEFN